MRLTENGYTVGLYTLGCKVSQYETEAIAEAFEDLGFTRLDATDTCDVYVINTCTVTAEAGRKCRQVIRRAIQKNPRAIVMVTGCHSQTNPEQIADIEGVAYIGGTADKLALPREAQSLILQREIAPVMAVSSLDGIEYEEMTVKTPPRTRAYVKIEDGCECRCTYCAIPNARGRVRSRNRESVINEIKYLTSHGVREIVLTGIEIASYGRDLDGIRLIDLLEEIDSLSLDCRIRLGSITPELLVEDFIQRIAALKCVTPHFHISLQSGCDKTLAAMKRRYNTSRVRTAMERLRTLIPRVTFTCDVIVGFPGESEEDFRDSCEFVRESRFLDAHIFAYSRRKDTPAASYPQQISESVKKERSHTLIQIQKQITHELLCEMAKEKAPLYALFETFCDGEWHGHTDTYAEVCVRCDGDMQGKAATVIPTHAENGKIYGTLMPESTK